jgi:hypothetical protein
MKASQFSDEQIVQILQQAERDRPDHWGGLPGTWDHRNNLLPLAQEVRWYDRLRGAVATRASSLSERSEKSASQWDYASYCIMLSAALETVLSDRLLEKENSRLKRLLAERDLEVDALKELLAKKR